MEERFKPIMSAIEGRESFVADKGKLVHALGSILLYEGVLRNLVERGHVDLEELRRFFEGQSAILINDTFRREAAHYGYKPEQAQSIMSEIVDSLSWTIGLDVKEDK